MLSVQTISSGLAIVSVPKLSTDVGITNVLSSVSSSYPLYSHAVNAPVIAYVRTPSDLNINPILACGAAVLPVKITIESFVIPYCGQRLSLNSSNEISLHSFA